MAQITRLSQIGLGATVYAGFLPKTEGTAPAVQITRLSSIGITAGVYAGFVAKTEGGVTGPPKFRGFLRNVGRLSG